MIKGAAALARITASLAALAIWLAAAVASAQTPAGEVTPPAR